MECSELRKEVGVGRLGGLNKKIVSFFGANLGIFESSTSSLGYRAWSSSNVNSGSMCCLDITLDITLLCLILDKKQGEVHPDLI